MRAELVNAPVEVVVANHCYGLFELAAVYLSQQPPLLDQARLAIDALGCLVDGLEGRLGEAEDQLKTASASCGWPTCRSTAPSGPVPRWPRPPASTAGRPAAPTPVRAATDRPERSGRPDQRRVTDGGGPARSSPADGSATSP